MEPEESLPYTQETATGLYSEPDQSIPLSKIILILSSHLLLGFHGDFCPSVLPTKTIYALHASVTRYP
jgi:hypothetical protein